MKSHHTTAKNLYNKIIWIFAGDKLGDNAQLKVIATKLEQDYKCQLEIKNIVYNSKCKRANLILQKSLETVDQHKSDSLALDIPPDLIIFTGRRSVPVARWIKKQCLKYYKKKIKLVAIGKPRAPFFWFDLIISTPQYHLPNWVPNLINNDFTLNRYEKIDQSTEIIDQAIGQRKKCIVFLGGKRSGFIMGEQEVESIISTISLFKKNNPDHQVLLVCSKKTPTKAFDLLSEKISGEDKIFSWSTPDKPSYQDFLRDGDVFFVTEDSASVITEALSTAKRVYLLELNRRKNKPRRLSYWIDKVMIFSVYPFGLYDPLRMVRKFTKNLLDRGYIEIYDPLQAQVCSTSAYEALNKEFQNTSIKIASLFDKTIEQKKK